MALYSWRIQGPGYAEKICRTWKHVPCNLFKIAWAENASEIQQLLEIKKTKFVDFSDFINTSFEFLRPASINNIIIIIIIIIINGITIIDLFQKDVHSTPIPEPKRHMHNHMTHDIAYTWKQTWIPTEY